MPDWLPIEEDLVPMPLLYIVDIDAFPLMRGFCSI
jgi:hypothetical protein